MSRGKLVVATVAALSLGLAGDLVVTAQPRTPAAKPGAPPAKASEPKAAERLDRRPGQKSNCPIVIDADRMEALKREGLVIFTGNVVAKQDTSTQTADRMEVYLDERGERVLRIVSIGNVKVVTDDGRTGTGRRAEYYDDEQRLLLLGDAKVWQDENVVTGDRVTIWLGEERSIVEGGSQERVKSVFYPKREENRQTPAAAKKEERRPASCG